MKSERLPWTLGWVSLGIGLTELTFPEGLCRVIGVSKRHAGLMRVFGLREIASGLGLLLQPHRREWVWARVAGDALDLSLLGAALRLPLSNKGWLGAITTAATGVTLVDLFAAVKTWRSPRRPAGTVTPSLGMDLGSSAPAESWRGSGLAEDMGANPRRDDDSLPEAERQRMMKEAARELGLPDPDEHGTPR
ncbi:hypothetical protein ATI61_103498 [Archangium gephyra]|uniref:Cyclase/dehydrase n=1 Tax=Archangium gephyra TaxID=48 RepID=A0AAC8TDH7_9BACT|nr:hypothetical protein [Archangium gephyra]AKJ01783.1 cyclase/dehydrase [Archangium gephyra]REG34592.1 hypothetical protein ATI61_103498 [Archangium gephyra]